MKNKKPAAKNLVTPEEKKILEKAEKIVRRLSVMYRSRLDKAAFKYSAEAELERFVDQVWKEARLVPCDCHDALCFEQGMTSFEREK